MKILLTCQFFNYQSGSAMYVYELARQLKLNGHDVTVLSAIGGEISVAAVKNGIRTVDFTNVFDLQEEDFDIIHVNQKFAGEIVSDFFPDTPKVYTIHSEIESIEPVWEDESIKKYIAVRPDIVKKYKDLHPVLVYNGVDFTRFNRNNEKDLIEKKKQFKSKHTILFVGTIDALRRDSIEKLVRKSMSDDSEVWLVGRKQLNYADNFPKNVLWRKETFFIEKFVEACDETAGILLGRTTLEGWACGKPAWIYNIDDNGKVVSTSYHEPPQDMSGFDIINVTREIEEIYTNSKI